MTIASPVFLLSERIAEITLDPDTRQIANIVFFNENLRFRCKRCAVFCCKLGGPKVTSKDTKRLRRSRLEPRDFLDSTASEGTEPESSKVSALKQKEDGSCVFLQQDSENKAYKCRVYNLRPALCRLYPFEFERTDRSRGILRFIACCNGLNAVDGESVDRKFIEEQLLKSIVDLL